MSAEPITNTIEIANGVLTTHLATGITQSVASPSTQNDTEGYPLNLMPGWFLAICLIRTLKDDPLLDLTGEESAISEIIRPQSPEFVLGTDDDVDQRFFEAVRIVFEQINAGRLGLALTERALTQHALLVPGSATQHFTRVAALFGSQLRQWCGKPNPVDA